MEKFIVVRGEAATHKNNIDKLDNSCNVLDTYQLAEEDALEYIRGGARTAEVYRLETTFSVEKVAKIKNEIIEEVKL